jgi:hypothetical protein
MRRLIPRKIHFLEIINALVSENSDELLPSGVVVDIADIDAATLGYGHVGVKRHCSGRVLAIHWEGVFRREAL